MISVLESKSFYKFVGGKKKKKKFNKFVLNKSKEKSSITSS